MATKSIYLPDWAILPGIAIIGLGLWRLFAKGSGSEFHPISQQNKIRSDSKGGGHFGASRGTRDHFGLDFVVTPGEAIFSPISGQVTRYSAPYDNDARYSGLVIQNDAYLIKLFYVAPSVKPGTQVSRGQRIGVAQKISTKYGSAMIDHVHVEVWPGGKGPVDPAPFFGV